MPESLTEPTVIPVDKETACSRQHPLRSYIRDYTVLVKIDFSGRRDKEGHFFLMIKGSICQEDIIISLPNSRAPKRIKWNVTEVKGEIVQQQ